MIVESMSNEELRSAIEADLVKMKAKAEFHIKSIRKVMRKTNMTSFKKYFPYFSPNKNHWIYGIEATPKEHALYLCVYYYTKQGTTVVQIATGGTMNKFNGHLLERYYERQKREVSIPQQWIINYMEEIRAFNAYLLEEISPGHYKVFLTVSKGACLGEFIKKLKMYDLKTFITPDIMFPEQLAFYNTGMISINSLLNSIKLK